MAAGLGSIGGLRGAGVRRRGLLVAALSVVALAGRAIAADLPVKAPPPAPAIDYDWTGFYVGGHVGYAGGSSDWSAAPTAAVAPPLGGSLDLYNGPDAFKGTGSYFAGFQAGYTYMLPSRLVLGAEADVSFPNTIAGTSTLSSAAIGVATYAEQVEFSGTVRGRIGYAPNLGKASHWLFYATGGLAWTYDQFTRTQLAGAPAGGTAIPGQVENLFMVPRVGGTAGAGVEYALPLELVGAARIFLH